MKARKGDIVECMGICATIDKILYQDFWENWDIEFIDTNGNYRHWKQGFDGGRLIQKERRAYDCYGNDVTDLYIKYGQPI